MKTVRHAAFILAVLFVVLGLPALLLTDTGALFPGRGADGVTGASTDPQDHAGEELLVLINREKHPDTLRAWSDYFLDRPSGAVAEEISCMTVQGDPAGIWKAEQYRAGLAAGQMRVRQENPILVVSRMENGLFDVVILSRDTADRFQFSTAYEDPCVEVLPVKGDAP